MKELRILQCPCALVANETGFQAELEKMLLNGCSGYSVAINATKIMMYSSSDLVRNLIDNALVRTPDGFGVVLGAKLLYGTRVQKVHFPRLILKICNKLGLKLFVLGATEDSNAAACTIINEKYPGIKLVGRMNGYFEQLSEVREEIKNSRPHVVLIGMGSPRQEEISLALTKVIHPCFFVGCGGALDVIAGKVKPAPGIFVDNGLEWLYRLAREPSRIYRQRVLVGFMIRLSFEYIKKVITSK